MKIIVRTIRRAAFTGNILDDRTMEIEGAHGTIALSFNPHQQPTVVEIETDVVGETYEPIQLDLGTLIARLEQIKEDWDARDSAYSDAQHWLLNRVMTCDLPRLQHYLTTAMRAEIDEAKK